MVLQRLLPLPTVTRRHLTSMANTNDVAQIARGFTGLCARQPVDLQLQEADHGLDLSHLLRGLLEAIDAEGHDVAQGGNRSVASRAMCGRYMAPARATDRRELSQLSQGLAGQSAVRRRETWAGAQLDRPAGIARRALYLFDQPPYLQKKRVTRISSSLA